MTTDQLLSFGTLLKRYRRAAELSQEQLAERAGYSAVYIRKLEAGARRPIASTVELLAHALNLEHEERAVLQEAA
jgi:transcriptional regulator with XRE-family HTH domain